MKDIIYLAVDYRGVRRMTKRLPELHRGEIPVKLIIEVDRTAFREPVITQHIKITDWREGIDLPDVGLREMFITEAEAELIRQQRLDTMVTIVRDHGYQVSPGQAPDGTHA